MRRGRGSGGKGGGGGGGKGGVWCEGRVAEDVVHGVVGEEGHPCVGKHTEESRGEPAVEVGKSRARDWGRG